MLESQCSAVLVRSEKARVRPESLACFSKIWLLCEDGKVLIKPSTEHHEHLMLKWHHSCFLRKHHRKKDKAVRRGKHFSIAGEGQWKF